MLCDDSPYTKPSNAASYAQTTTFTPRQAAPTTFVALLTVSSTVVCGLRKGNVPTSRHHPTSAPTPHRYRPAPACGEEGNGPRRKPTTHAEGGKRLREARASGCQNQKVLRGAWGGPTPRCNAGRCQLCTSASTVFPSHATFRRISKVQAESRDGATEEIIAGSGSLREKAHLFGPKTGNLRRVLFSPRF